MVTKRATARVTRVRVHKGQCHKGHKDQGQQVQEVHTIEDAHLTAPDHKADIDPTVETEGTDQDQCPATRQ